MTRDTWRVRVQSARASWLLWTLILGLLQPACAQTDVIARAGNALCLHDADCDGAGSCPAQICAAPAAANSCSSTTPSVLVGDGCGDADDSAPAFRFALCSCTDFVSQHAFSAEAWNATGTKADSSAASVGINGTFTSTAKVSLQGSLQVSGKLSVPDAQLAISGAVIEAANNACNCATANLLDVTQLVAAHLESNDNAAHGFLPASLDRAQAVSALTLGCGNYYAPHVSASPSLELHVQGRVALFVGGDIELDHDLRVTLDPGSSFELFVGGNVRVSGQLLLGDAQAAPNARLYVGGSGTIDVGGDALIAGDVYAPHSELVTRGTLTTYGALFVRRAAPGGDVSVHYNVNELTQTTPSPATCAAISGP